MFLDSLPGQCFAQWLHMQSIHRLKLSKFYSDSRHAFFVNTPHLCQDVATLNIKYCSMFALAFLACSYVKLSGEYINSGMDNWTGMDYWNCIFLVFAHFGWFN